MGQEDSKRAAPERRVRLDFGAGGWVLVLAMVLVGAVFLWRISDMLRSRGERAVGDGIHPETYGFDFRNCEVPRELLIGSGLPRDGLPVLDLPPVWSRAVVDSLARAGRNKYLVSGDRVIGVVINGHARAYPLLALNWHEVVNDTLGGVPIAVTYSPLCDAAVVYDRRLPPRDGALPVGASVEASSEAPAGTRPDAAEPVRFGHSGILYNSDLLLYDRRPGHAGESLWIQLTGEPISGPAKDAGVRLVPLPCRLVRWADWKEQFKETTVPARDPARKESYRREPYVSYFGNDLLRYPVSPLPPRDRMPYKTPCVILSAAGPSVRPGVYPLPVIARNAEADGQWRTTWQGTPVVFRYHDRPPTAWVEVDAAPTTAPLPNMAAGQAGAAPGLSIRYTFWFAWYAMSGGTAAAESAFR